MTTSSAALAARFSSLTSAQRTRLLSRLVAAGRLAEIPEVIPPRDGEELVRLSPAQQDLWTYECVYPGTGALNLCCAYHFKGPVDPARLEAALTRVQADHDILRTRITGPADDPRVTFAPRARFLLERADLPATGARLPDVLTAFARGPFSPGGQLFKGLFVRVDDDHATLVLKLHHIITDWWSFNILHTDFSDAFRTLSEERQPRSRRPEIQYADFADWQRELESAGVFEAQLAFWRGYLADLPPPLMAGGKRGGGPGPASEPGIEHIPVALGPRTEATIRSFAAEHGATVYGVLMTAFAVLAYRLSGQRDAIIGTPMANRMAMGLDRVIGYVMNAVPTRWRIDSRDTFADLVRRFTAEFPVLLANAGVPVGRIVTALGPPRTPGRSPLFQWVFMYLPGQASVRALREFTEPQRVQTGGEHDVVAVIQETPDGIAGGLEIRTDVYPVGVVRHWADSFGVLLDGLLAEPRRPVGEVPLLAGAGHSSGWASGSVADLPAASIADLVAGWATRTPDAVALESDGIRLSYAELARRARGLARQLTDRGVAPGDLVALALPRSAEAVIAMLAAQHAAAAYLPIDPGYPERRVRFMLEDAAPTLLITNAEVADGLPALGTPRLVVGPLTADPPPGEAGPGQPGPGEATDPRHAGYVMYTSGSTGRPKAVVVTHRGIASLANALVRRLGLTTSSRILQAGSPSFDISVAELCMAFGSGGTLVIPPGGPLAGESLGSALKGERITSALLPPTAAASVPAGEYPDLRALALGGEACPADLIARWSATGRRIVNAYGPTEDTVAATLSDPLPPTAPGAPPIGRSITNGRTYVLDSLLRPVPAGVPGELYLAGDGLARGYLGRPGLTAERFVADPHATPPGSRMYRTGDVAQWRDDGQLDFLGRSDDQVSMRGYRIEPAEIESVLAAHDSVAQAVVQLRADRLVGYLVPAPGRAVDHGALREYAMAALPVHMVPTVFVTMDALPVTPHGKLDRSALPTPANNTPGAARPPDTPREALLCGLFTELLDVQAGPDDDFFSLGGDSIVAIQLASRARAAGLEFAPREVFTSRTPATLAAVARDVARDTAADADSGGNADRPPLVELSPEEIDALEDDLDSLTGTEQP